MRLTVDRLDSPAGPIVIVANDAGLVAVDFGEPEDRLWGCCDGGSAPIEAVPARDPLGASSALRPTWPAGWTRSTICPSMPAARRSSGSAGRRCGPSQPAPPGAIASWRREIGRPAAVRAVGLANGANPVGIVVPCHRVIGADGSLTGYGGGLERKRWLLEHEGVLLRIGA